PPTRRPKTSRPSSREGAGGPGPDGGIGQTRIHFSIELVDNVAWRVFGGCDAIPRTCLIARQKIAHGGKVRQHLGARRGRYRKRAQSARSNVSDRARQNVEHDVDLTAYHVGECRRRAAIGHMYEVDPGHHLEELAGNMDRCSSTAGCHIDPARIGLGVGDELGNCSRWNRGVDLHDEGDADDGSDGRDILDEIEAEIFIKRRIDRIARRDLQECVYPSGGALRAVSVPILLAAPARFSTTNWRPRRSKSHCAITRATMSVGPPAEKPTMMRTGRAG